MRTALLIGASGLVGGLCLEKLLKNENYGKVTILVRSIMEKKNPKLEQVVVNFDAIEKYSEVIKADDIFSAIGTTKKNARTEEIYTKIEYDYVVNTAKIALENGASQFLTVSSMGANPNSRIFYSRLKARVEDAVSNLGFKSVFIFRPSFIAGDRKEHRSGEGFLKALMKILSVVMLGPFKKWKAINADAIAEVMVWYALQNITGIHIIESNKIQQVYNTIV